MDINPGYDDNENEISPMGDKLPDGIPEGAVEVPLRFLSAIAIHECLPPPNILAQMSGEQRKAVLMEIAGGALAGAMAVFTMAHGISAEIALEPSGVGGKVRELISTVAQTIRNGMDEIVKGEDNDSGPSYHPRFSLN